MISRVPPPVVLDLHRVGEVGDEGEPEADPGTVGARRHAPPSSLITTASVPSSKLAAT